MLKPEFVQENETHNILKDFEIQADPLIPVRRPDLALINTKKKKKEKKKKRKRTKKRKKKKRTSGFCRPIGPQSEKKRKLSDNKNLDLVRKLKQM